MSCGLGRSAGQRDGVSGQNERDFTADRRRSFPGRQESEIYLVQGSYTRWSTGIQFPFPAPDTLPYQPSRSGVQDAYYADFKRIGSLP